MKKMSEVFKLPVKAARMDDEHAQEILKSGESHYCLEDGGYWMASNIEHIESAVHAINHADALAEALDSMIKSIESDCVMRSDIAEAKAALAAYRGKA